MVTCAQAGAAVTTKATPTPTASTIRRIMVMCFSFVAIEWGRCR
jgi:hypothetical protein